MGMYTGIRFSGIVKPEFREGFEDIALGGDWENSPHEILRRFDQVDRASFIPNGVLCYMPWKDDCPIYGTPKWNEETGEWKFQCSLKNYSCTIEEFFELIPYFIESIEHLEYFYEEDTYSQQYDLVNGEVIRINTKCNQYGEE